MRGHRNLGRLGLTAIVILLLGAVSADAASAHVGVERNGFWYKSSTKLTTGTAESISCASSGSFTIEGHTNTVLGIQPVKLQASGISCPGGQIVNEGSKAKASTKLKFTGVTVLEPSACEVPGKTIETKALKGQIWMEEGTSKPLLRLEPVSGTLIAKVAITTGCALQEAYAVEGFLFAEDTSATGVTTTTPHFNFSGPINATASGTGLMFTFDHEPATLTGTLTATVSGGSTWGVNES